VNRLRLRRRILTAIVLAVALCAGRAETMGVYAQQRGAASDAAVERPLILGIAHVAFRVSALSGAEQFYHDVLGLKEAPRAASAAAGAGAERARFVVNNRQEILIEAGLPPDTDERLSHLAFETSDLDALAAYFKVHGVTIESTPLARCAARALWVKDPDGHAIEFVERQQPAAHASASATAVAAAAPHNGNDNGARAISARVLHAGLTIRDPEAADRFYKEVLGFSEFWRGGSSDTVTSWINMKVPNGTDYLEYMLVSGSVTRQRLGSAHHVALLVPDIQAAYETAVSRTPPAARQKLASPNVGRNGRWQLNLYDPDGSRVELMEPFRVR